MQVTFEAPPGLKRNLQRTYAAWGPELLAAGTPLRAQLLFLLAWFHGIVQERRSFVPQVSRLPPTLLPLCWPTCPAPRVPCVLQAAPTWGHQPGATKLTHLPWPPCGLCVLTQWHRLLACSEAACLPVPSSPPASRSYNDSWVGLVGCARPQPCHRPGCLPIKLAQAL